MSLAAQGGFENVRQRDVAAGAGIALGTLYKRFRSKEDILSALLEREADGLARRLTRKPARGDDEEARVCDFYGIVTRWLCRKPHLARAMLRAMTAADEHATDNVTKYHVRMVGLVVRAMRAGAEGSADARAFDAAMLLQHVWFAALVGWAAGAQSQARVIEIMELATRAILRGLPTRA